MAVAVLPKYAFEKVQSIYTIVYKYNLRFDFNITIHYRLLAYLKNPMLSAITDVCLRSCHLMVTTHQEVLSPSRISLPELRRFGVISPNTPLLK